MAASPRAALAAGEVPLISGDPAPLSVDGPLGPGGAVAVPEPVEPALAAEPMAVTEPLAEAPASVGSEAASEPERTDDATRFVLQALTRLLIQSEVISREALMAEVASLRERAEDGR